MKKEDGHRDRELVLGVDGGGSKTAVAVATVRGELLGLARGGPSRLELVGSGRAKTELERAIEEALREADAKKEQVAAACFGFGGMDTERARRSAAKIAEEIGPASGTFRIADDALVGLYSGTFGRPGISVIAGTGALIRGVNGEGETARVDGWGHLFGDLGSAYYIGSRAIRAALEALDGRGKETALEGAIVDELELEEIAEVIDLFYGVEDAPTKIARLAPSVDRLAEEGDAVAREIISSAAEELVRSTLTLIERLKLEDLHPLRVVPNGGVFRSTLVKEGLREGLEENLSERTSLRFVDPAWEPVVGALVMALEEAGVEVGARVRDNLRQISF